VAGTHQPETFGRFSLLEKIATGGMAEVYRARAYGTAGFEKIVVIKKILPQLLSDAEFIKMFINEARIAVQLIHANIVQVFDLGEVQGQYFMSMEHVHGLDLSRVLTRARDVGPVPIHLACLTIVEILKALQFAHECVSDEGKPMRIVHCDISPQNVLISYAGEVKITDFGISKAAFQARGSQQVIRGKCAYMSPEQVEGRSLDGRTDLFSLGVIFYEMLTGTRLFKGGSRDETLARVRKTVIPSVRAIRPEVSEKLEALIAKSLSRRRDDRYDTAQQMLNELRALIVDETHRATNADLASYLKEVTEVAAGVERSRQEAFVSGAPVKSTPVVALSIEVSSPPRTISVPRSSVASVTQEWTGIVEGSGGEVWERGALSMVVVWTGKDGVEEPLARAVQTVISLQQATLNHGYRLSAGLAPGVCRICVRDKRPSQAWELSGPFYLSRWMMNLSAHRGRVLVTEVIARQVPRRCELLGRIPIQGNRYVNVYELH